MEWKKISILKKNKGVTAFILFFTFDIDNLQKSGKVVEIDMREG